jgi:hypothetical protein
VKKIIATLMLIAASGTAHAQTPTVGKALEKSMLAGSSFGSGSCTELTDLFNGNVERAYGKAKKDQITMALMEHTLIGQATLPNPRLADGCLVLRVYARTCPARRAPALSALT